MDPAALLTDVFRDVFAWIVFGTFLLGVVVAHWDRRIARNVTVGAWVMFALFWLWYVPFFAFEHRSIIQAVLAAVGVPLSLFVGYHLAKGRDSLLLLSKAVGFMGLIYLPFETIPLLHDTLIEIVARQVEIGIRMLGYDPTIDYNEAGLRNIILFEHESGATFGSVIIFACTGIGSMAIFGGLIAAVDEPLRKRVAALAFTVSIIWVLNIARNVFIAVSHGQQLFHHELIVGPVMFLFGLNSPTRVSFFFSDRIVSQLLAIVVLVAIFWVVMRILPRLTTIVEDLLFLITGDEFDIQIVDGSIVVEEPESAASIDG